MPPKTRDKPYIAQKTLDRRSLLDWMGKAAVLTLGVDLLAACSPDNSSTSMSPGDDTVPQTIEFAINKEDLPYVLRNRDSAPTIKSAKLIAIPRDGVTLDFADEPVVLNNTAEVKFIKDPSIGVPSANFTGTIPLGNQNLELSPVVLQHIGDVKDLMLVCMLEVT